MLDFWFLEFGSWTLDVGFLHAELMQAKFFLVFMFVAFLHNDLAPAFFPILSCHADAAGGDS